MVDILATEYQKTSPNTCITAPYVGPPGRSATGARCSGWAHAQAATSGPNPSLLGLTRHGYTHEPADNLSAGAGGLSTYRMHYSTIVDAYTVTSVEQGQRGILQPPLANHAY